jgi:hypothetical protein
LVTGRQPANQRVQKQAFPISHSRGPTQRGSGNPVYGGNDRRMTSEAGLSRIRAGVAQLVAQTTCNRQVVGSIPTAGSNIPSSERYTSTIYRCWAKTQQPTQQVEEPHGRQYSTAQSRGVRTARVHRSRSHRTGTSQVRDVRAAERELARLITQQEDRPARIPEREERTWGPTTTINDAIEGWKQNRWPDLSPHTVRGLRRGLAPERARLHRTAADRHTLSLGHRALLPRSQGGWCWLHDGPVGPGAPQSVVSAGPEVDRQHPPQPGGRHRAALVGPIRAAQGGSLAGTGGGAGPPGGGPCR